MARTIVITRLSNGGVTVVVNGGTPRGIDNAIDVAVKPIDNGLGCVCKTTDEQWRIRLFLSDTITINGVAAPTVLADLITVLLQFVFGGSQAYAAPGTLAQTITFAAMANRAHTAPAFSAGATSSSGLGVTYVSSSPGVATVNATTGLITPVSAGSTNITASQAGNGFYAAATPVVQPLTLT